MPPEVPPGGRDLLAHVTVLEFLPAAAWAGVVAADALAPIANRLDGLVVGGRIGIGSRRLIGRFCGDARRRLVCRRGNLPERSDEPRALLLKSENRAGHLLSDSLPHPFEGLHSL